ncbi:MAG: response regulator, partial [Polyangiaceae bacterium]|nr:response regulator [Polyangiaceae bacterium]
EVASATDASVAVDRVRATRPHVVLLDYHLGGATGADVVRAIRAFDPLVQILLVTGYASEQPARRMLTELDIQLVAHQPPLPAVNLAQDNTSGSNATLGGKGQCFKNPLPVGGPAKVILKATAGSGIGVAQVYVK